ncbi:MAG: hypothetical protein PHR75_06945 [Sulfurovum sp.]|nr:hypothetical protein [Sulfurovum sp.]MDD3602452.1 hypothetical protein [Sulfurovum sp.]
MDEMVYPFAPSKKLYQVNGEWVKASCGGENISGEGHDIPSWDGKQDNECLMIDNPQEEKIVGKEEMPNHLSFYLDARVIPTFSGFLVSHDCVPDGGCLDTNLPPFVTCPNAWEQAANRHSGQKQYVDNYISSVISEAINKYGEDAFTISYSHEESQRTCSNNECNIHTWHCFASQGVHLHKK